MLLFSLILHIRHWLYDKGVLKSVPSEIPSICVGNVSVGGTGKTPMTEMIIRTLLDDGGASARQGGIAVLSRGYRRRTRGFRLVTADGTAGMFGDEPLQIKRKYPEVTVAVDSDRVEGCSFLAHPSLAGISGQVSSEVIADKPGIIILDDAFQHRRVKASRSMVLTTYRRPFSKDMLLPFGRLRDLRSRALAADMVVVTKCPGYMDDGEKTSFAEKLGLEGYDPVRCEGTNRLGKVQKLLFSTMEYSDMRPVFPEGDAHYIHSKMVVMFSAIADDVPFAERLADTYSICGRFSFADHHFFNSRDVRRLEVVADKFPTSLFATTEKDAQRLLDIRDEISPGLRRRIFCLPLELRMLSEAEQACFGDFVKLRGGERL